MNNPPVSKLLTKVDAKYTLIAMASKRARQYIDEKPEQLAENNGNPVTMALMEIADGTIYWERIKDGLK